jgi:hypothetical protein
MTGKEEKRMAEKINYSAVVAALEDEKARVITQFEAAIEAIKLLAVRPTAGSGVTQMPLGAGPSNGETAVYSGMSVREAALTYLRAMGKARTTKEIAQSLVRGGISSTSDNFQNNVYTRLYRSTDDFERTPSGKWALKEWKEHKAAAS